MATPPQPTKPLRHLTVDLDSSGFGAVTVDGVDITRAITGLTIKARAGRALEAHVDVPPGSLALDAPAAIVVRSLPTQVGRTRLYLTPQGIRWALQELGRPGTLAEADVTLAAETLAALMEDEPERFDRPQEPEPHGVADDG